MTSEVKAPGDTWRVLVITSTIQALVAMAALAVPAVAPAFAVRLDAPVSLLGIYMALLYLGAILSSLMAGQAVRRHGAIRVSQAGLVCCAVGSIIVLAPSIWVVGLGAVLIGMGYGPITPASSHLLAASTPPDRAALVFSIKQTGVPLGGMLAGVVAPPMTQHAGLPAALMVVALLCLACVFLAQPLRAQLDADRAPTTVIRVAGLLHPLRMVLSHDGLRRLATTSFVFSAVQLCLASYLVTYLHNELGYGLVVAGAALSMAQLGGVVGRVAWGQVADRYLGALRTLVVIAVLMAASAVATGMLDESSNMVWVMTLLLCFGASATGWNGVYLSAVARLAPAGMAGAATGGALSVTFLGVVVGPAVFGVLSELAGGFGPGYMLTAIPVLLCVLLLVGKRVRRSA